MKNKLTLTSPSYFMLILSLLGLLHLASCQSTKTAQTSSDSTTTTTTTNKESTSNAKELWPQQMQRLTSLLSELLPLLTDPKSYSNTEKKKFYESRIAELKEIAHAINETTPAPDHDPTLKLVGKRFEENLNLSLESFNTGHYEFSRTIFKNALAQCVQCHTRSDVGPALAQPHFVNSLSKVAIVEKVQFLIASRYFDDAMKEIHLAIENGSNLSIVAWQKLVQMGLIINARFRHDSKRTQQFLHTLSQSKNIPFFIKRNLPFWENSTKEWSRKPRPTVTIKSAQQIITRADLAQKNSRSDGGTIDYLRAGSLLHQFLAKTQEPSAKAEALFQLGMIYENIGEIGAWSMNEDYYELCIRTQPHTDIAKKCFERFKQSTISGYSGTGGLNIPDDAQKRLVELRAIAL